MNKGKKILAAAAAAVIAIAGVSITAVDVKTKNRILKEEDFTKFYINEEDAIYFLNTGSSDAIVLQSQGHFAMIDSGEDNDNPRNLPGLEYKGYEKEITDFLKRTASDSNGDVYLDFILGTHSHSDHIGGFDTIINDDKIFIEKAYLKEYRSENIRDKEIEEWDNQEVYDQMVTALNNKSIPIISEISSVPFQFGNFTLTFMNTEYENGNKKIGENDNSVVVLVEKDGKKALLTGDLDNSSGDEVRIAQAVGKVDLLKVGHHSYAGSTGSRFLKLVSPETAVITNNYKKADKFTLARISTMADASIALADDVGGIAAVFTDGEIIYTCNIGL